MTVINNLKMRIEGENKEYASQAMAEGFEVRIVRNATIITCKFMTNVVDGFYPYEIPKFVVDENIPYAFAMDTCERGGCSYSSVSGHAHIVCGSSGKALVPYLIPRGDNLANGTHALFCIFERFVSVGAVFRYKNEDITITNITALKPDPGCYIAGIKKEVLWSGKICQLPLSMGKYSQAVKAAQEKMHCQGCTHNHYILEK